MKIRSFFVSMLAIAALASCSNNDEFDNLVPEQTSGNAYLALSVNMPQGGSTRANSGPTIGNGTEQESKLTSIYVVGLKDNAIRGVYQVNGATAEAFKVASDINKVFVVANPSTKMLAQMKAAASYAAMNLAIAESVNEVAKTNNFMMTSAGVSPADKGLTTVTPVVATNESTEAINAAKATALTNKATVNIDRVMSKVWLKSVARNADKSVVAENGKASVDTWLLNTTNKNYYPYAELTNYTVSGTPAKYRVDTNFEKLDMAAATNAFNWLSNTKDNGTWNQCPNPEVGPAIAAQYCLENTMSVAGQVYGNTTKMVVKATFTPNGIENFTSWFRMGGVVMTFDQVNASYATASTADKATYSLFLDKLLTASRTKGWKGEGKTTEVTLADLDAIGKGGYLAATVNPYLIEYFQKSVCYYDILIKHDNRVQSKLLGRWGVVRNNDYHVNITKITKPGLPYIPDPTDPAITDPSKPNPETPNDETSSFIAVDIVVNPWTSWEQDNEL